MTTLAQTPTWFDLLTEPGVPFDERCDRWEAFCRHLPERGDPACPLRHAFCDGLYTREVTMPTGSIILSRIHRFEHMFFVRLGRVRVITHDDDKVYCGGDMGITLPGARRILLIEEETVWATVHPNPANIGDPEVLFEFLTDPSPTPYPVPKELPCP